jgi:hypothetical protein
MRVPVVSTLGSVIVLIAATAAQSPKSNLITVAGTVTAASGASVEGSQAILKLVQCKCSECETPECKCCPTRIVVDIARDGKYTVSVPHGTYVFEVRNGGLTAQSELDLNEGEQKVFDVILH